jgi:hypothetical protein
MRLDRCACGGRDYLLVELAYATSVGGNRSNIVVECIRDRGWIVALLGVKVEVRHCPSSVSLMLRG